MLGAVQDQVIAANRGIQVEMTTEHPSRAATNTAINATHSHNIGARPWFAEFESLLLDLFQELPVFHPRVGRPSQRHYLPQQHSVAPVERRERGGEEKGGEGERAEGRKRGKEGKGKRKEEREGEREERYKSSLYDSR